MATVTKLLSFTAAGMDTTTWVWSGTREDLGIPSQATINRIRADDDTSITPDFSADSQYIYLTARNNATNKDQIYINLSIEYSLPSRPLFLGPVTNTGQADLQFNRSLVEASGYAGVTANIITKGFGYNQRIILKGYIPEPPAVVTYYIGSANLTTKKTTTGGFYRSIIDDSDSAVESYLDWTLSLNKGYNNTNYRYFFPGFGASSAWWQWNHAILSPDIYEVHVTWVANTNRPTNTKYEVITAGQPTKTFYVNQQLSPSGPVFGGVQFQSLTSIYATAPISIRVYGHDTNYAIADATMVSRVNHFVKPVYTGGGKFNKSAVLNAKGVRIVPVFSATSKLNVKNFGLTGKATYSVPVYRGNALLSKHPQLIAGIYQVIPVYSGTMAVVIPKSLQVKAYSTVPYYTAQSNLNIKRVEFVASANFIIPQYTGNASLHPKPVLVAYGVNIVEGFIYQDVLYITEKIVRTNYIKFDEDFP